MALTLWLPAAVGNPFNHPNRKAIQFENPSSKPSTSNNHTSKPDQFNNPDKKANQTKPPADETSDEDVASALLGNARANDFDCFDCFDWPLLD